MDQRRMSKDNCSFNQSTSQNQSFNPESGYQRFSNEINFSPFLIEDDVKKAFKQSKKIISEIKSRNDQEPINIVTLEKFIMKSNLFFDSTFTNILDKRILFAAFAMIHQYYLSSNFVPFFEHMLPFSSLWETFQKAFNFLDFDSYNSKIDETIDKIKNIIDNGKRTVADDNFTDDYDDIVATFSLLFQCFESIKLKSSDSANLIEQCYLAIDNAFKYINEAQSITSSSIQEIQVQLTILQQLLKSYQKTSNMYDCIDQINNLLLVIPSTFDAVKFNSNNCMYSDVTFLSKILKYIIDFYSIFFKLMINVTDWKEAKSLYTATQEIYTLIEQPFLTASSNFDISKLVKNFKEKVASLACDRSLKDAQIYKDLNAVINLLPPELIHVRSSFTNFSVKRREVIAEPSDSNKIFHVYQACINFASQLRPSNGPIYNLTYKLLQAYSRALINSIVTDNLEIVTNNLNIISIIFLSKNSMQKNIESSIISEISKIAKLAQDFTSCGIISDDYKDFMNRFQIYIFYLKNLISNSIKMQSNSISRILPVILQNFPNFQDFKITKKWLNKDFNSLFKAKTEMVQSQFSQFENESGDSESFHGIKKSIDSVFSAYGHYGQIIKEFDHEMIGQFNKYFRFKKCLEDFANFLQKDESSSNGNELLIEPTDFSILLENILEKIQTDKIIFDLNAVKICFDLSICLLYKEKANPEVTIKNYINLLKIFNPPSFKQKLQISLRYSELFVLMENENETIIDDDGNDANVAHNFGESLISFCSDQKEETFDSLTNLYASLKRIIPTHEFSGFENLFESIQKIDPLISNINQINSFYFHFPEYQKELNAYDITMLFNMIESFVSSLEKFNYFKVLSKESIDSVQKVLDYAKEINPISIYSFIIYNNPEMEKIELFEPSDGKNLKQFISTFSKMLTDLFQTIKFTDYQRIVKDELSIFSSMFSYYLNWYPELKSLSPQFCEFIDLTNQIMTDFTPILFRILKVINVIYYTLKKSCELALEITALYQINQKIHSIIMNALNINSIEKDLKIVLNCLNSFSMKYQNEEELDSNNYYQLTDFFNYQKVNSISVQQLFEMLQVLYEYDLKISGNSPDDLSFTEIYDVVTPSLSIIDNLFDESTFYFIKNFFTDGCKQIDSSIKRLGSTITSIDNKIKEERKLIKASKMSNNDDDDDDDMNEISEFTDMREKLGISSILVDNQNESQDTSNQPLKENIFESILNMYKNILDRKIKHNKMIEQNIDELRAKIEDHKNEMNGINEEYMNYVQQSIPTEFDNYAKLILEPMKCFQAQETTNSEKSEDPNSEDDSQLDIFSGSEFNSFFVNTIIMKIEELEQQNISLSRYINIQSFYSMVDDYIKSCKIKENQGDETQPNNNNNDDDEKFTPDVVPDVEPDANEGENAGGGDDDEYEYEYEYVDDDVDKKSEYEQFEQDEIKLITMINSLRNCGKNKSTLKEIISADLKESISQIELDFYRLIEKSGELFNVEELTNDHDNDNEVFSNLLGNSQRNSKYISRKASDKKKNLIRLAQSLIQDVPSDDN